MAKILIIEDEIALLEAYSFILKHQGHTVSAAHNGEEGLVKVKKVLPDLIVVDMMMPKLDGLGFLQRYGAAKHPEVKILMLSNMSSPEYVAKAMGLGANRYEIKATLTPQALLKVIDELL